MKPRGRVSTMAQWADNEYGHAFADVYDEWYSGLSDLAAVASFVAERAAQVGAGPVLELGVGTGRIALALADAGLAVVGIDISPEMLKVARSKPGANRLVLIEGDMVDDLPAGPFSVVVAPYNAVFNLMTVERQRALLDRLATRLSPGGAVIIETTVFGNDQAGDHVGIRTLEPDRVVLSVTRQDPDRRVAQGQFIDITNSGVRLRPWQVRWSTLDELDADAGRVGLSLTERYADWSGTRLTELSHHHVSVYRCR
jgi:SAM-dependent methyltransferase